MIKEFRRFARKITLDILGRFAVAKPGIHILNGHFLSLDDAADPAIFEGVLTAMEDLGIEFLDFEEAVQNILDRQIPNAKCQIAFSFDDGFLECQTKLSPVLNKRGIQAAFFINPGFIEGSYSYQENFMKHVVSTMKPSLTWEQVELIHKDGHLIGAHTMDHQRLDHARPNDLEYQIGYSKDKIAEKIGKCEHFAFPYGRIKDINPKAVDCALNYFKFLYSQDNYREYFSFSNKVINRRHFECDWPIQHILYFLKHKRYEH